VTEIANKLPATGQSFRYVAEGAARLQLRQIAREARWTRLRIRIVGWVLRLIDPR